MVVFGNLVDYPGKDQLAVAAMDLFAVGCQPAAVAYCFANAVVAVACCFATVVV